MYRLLLPIVVPAVAALLALPAAADKPDDGFVAIFTGKDLTGWKVSPKTGHSRTSKNMFGGKWVIEDGAIVGSQDVPGNGCIIITEKEYGGFEVALEMKSDNGPDSGLFLRSTDTGKCYQAMIDYHRGGNLMGITVRDRREAARPELRLRQGDVTEIIVPSKRGPSDSSASGRRRDKWTAFWKPSEVERAAGPDRGNPPKITTWIRGSNSWSTRHRKASSRQGGLPCRSTAAGLHEAVRPLPEYPGEGTSGLIQGSESVRSQPEPVLLTPDT